jgi:hypothetical protein
MPAFINEYPVKITVGSLQSHKITYDPALEKYRRFRYKASSQLSRELTDQLRIPVCSLGDVIYVTPEVKLPAVFTLTMKLEGSPTDVELFVQPEQEIKSGNLLYPDVARRYVNRVVDVQMTSGGYFQDGRGFYENTPKDLGKSYASYSGFFISTLSLSDGTLALVVDPTTLVRAKSNLRSVLNEELEKRGISHWRDALPYQDEINKVLRSRAYSLRSTYTERRPEDPDPTYLHYKFRGFDFSRDLGDESDPRSPAGFHSSFDRKFDLDQPRVEVTARGGYNVSQIPELLEEFPTMGMLRRYGMSGRIQARSQMDAQARYFMTTEHLKPLVKAGLIDETPLGVETEEFGPVRIVFESGYLELKTNYDFQKYFEKTRLLSKPQINHVHVFSTESDSGAAAELVRSLKTAMAEFGIQTDFHLDLSCPDTIDDFVKVVLTKTEEEGFTHNDLALIVFGFEDNEVQDAAYDQIKAGSLARLFPTQFVSTSSVEAEGRDLRKDVVNPLLIQIVAKCGGQPYGLQPGFVRSGTTFIGVDRYRDPFAVDSPLVTTVTLFDNEGNYVCGATDIAKTRDEDESLVLQALLSSCLKESSKGETVPKQNLALVFVDTGVGTQETLLRRDAKVCEEALVGFAEDYAYVSSNRDSHLRLYSGDPSDNLSAEGVSPFTGAIQMRDPQDLLVASTEPFVSKETGRIIGTQKPVLYRILDHSETLELTDLKRTIAKAVVWLCRHSWVSPASTRLPAPLFFANKLSRLSATTNTPLSANTLKAPLFL